MKYEHCNQIDRFIACANSRRFARSKLREMERKSSPQLRSEYWNCSQVNRITQKCTVCTLEDHCCFLRH